MKKSGIIVILAPILLLFAFPTCETSKSSKKKLGDTCGADKDCESGICYEGKCADALPCTKDSECDDKDDCTTDTCASGKFSHADIDNCGETCKCGDPNVTVDPGDCTWPDAKQCSAWHSVGGKDGQAYASGTKLCAMGCCITLVCP